MLWFILKLDDFTGKERDAESQLDYFGARYYASTMGRFMSPDWSAKAEPVPYAKLENPQSLNLYAYVGNNPLSRSDPTGHADIAAECKGQSTCNMTLIQTLNIVHQDKGGKYRQRFHTQGHYKLFAHDGPKRYCKRHRFTHR